MIINGSQVSESLEGTSGNDTFIGSMGNDTLDGNGGRDTVDYSDLTEPIILQADLATRVDKGSNGVDLINPNANGGSIRTIVGNEEARNSITGGGGDSFD